VYAFHVSKGLLWHIALHAPAPKLKGFSTSWKILLQSGLDHPSVSLIQRPLHGIKKGSLHW